MRRAGRWIDFENDYKTLNLDFMETVWWVFSQISKQGLVYRGMKVLGFLHSCLETEIYPCKACARDGGKCNILVFCMLLLHTDTLDLQVMPYSWKLSTTISNNEASENYKEVNDPAVMVRMTCFSRKYGSKLSQTHPETKMCITKNLAKKSKYCFCC